MKQIQKEDPLQLVCAWSIDPDHRSGVHRPEAVYVRKQKELPCEAELIVTRGKTVSVKVVDIFGNTAFERIETGNERDG